jgi:hypothetical protein
MEAPAPQPRPLTAATRGFVQLAGWLTGLAGQQALDAARALDDDRLDVTQAAARAATLPLLASVGVLSEALDAASVILHPPQQARTATSVDFTGPDDWAVGEQLEVPTLKNGFGERLPAVVTLTVEPSTVAEDRTFRLRATNVPHQCVGAYQGEIGPAGGAGGKVPVWLVIP